MLAGSREVTLRPFLGIRKDRRGDRTIISVEKVRSDGTVTLQGGWVNGLTIGSELRVWNDPDTTARITITAIHGLGRSDGRLPAGMPMPPSIRSGALMEVVGWTAPPGNTMRVQMPRVTEGVDAIAALARKLAAEAERRGLRWIDDPIETTPSFLLRRGPRGWELLGAEGVIERLGPDDADAMAGVAKVPADGVALRAVAGTRGAGRRASTSTPEAPRRNRPHRSRRGGGLHPRRVASRMGVSSTRGYGRRPSRRIGARPDCRCAPRGSPNTLRNTAATLGDAIVRLRKIQAWKSSTRRRRRAPPIGSTFAASATERG